MPFLRAVGYRFRPRFDFRHTGLGKTVRLAKWTLGFVLVTQAALVVITKAGHRGDRRRRRAAAWPPTTYAYAVWILPHSLITVSLATAMLPSASRLAARGRPGRGGRRDQPDHRGWPSPRCCRPRSLPGAGAADRPAGLRLRRGVPSDAGFIGCALMALAVGLVPFTLQYICLRAFYALENTRTPFFLQCLIAGCERGARRRLVFAARPAVRWWRPAWPPGLLAGVPDRRRRLLPAAAPTLPDLAPTPLVRHCVRLLLAVAPGRRRGLADRLGADHLVRTPSSCWALALVSPRLVAIAVFLVMARLLRIREVTDIVVGVAPSGRGGSGDRSGDPATGSGAAASGRRS